eukprot:s1809_g17.t1
MIKDELLTPGLERERHEAIRQAAREAFIKSQADSAVRRALQGRPRAIKTNFAPGDWVYIFRKSKNTGGAARIKQDAGEWIGPGTIVGVEGDSFWVSRGGRCLLCAREHLRPAESEELGMLLQAKVMQEDLLQLVHHLDEDGDNDDIFADAQDDILASDLDQLVPQKRARGKQDVPMVKPKLSFGAHEAFVLEEVDEEDFQLPKSFQKQLDKEVRWKDIPESEKSLYEAAEEKQWKEGRSTFTMELCVYYLLRRVNKCGPQCPRSAYSLQGLPIETKTWQRDVKILKCHRKPKRDCASGDIVTLISKLVPSRRRHLQPQSSLL